MPVKRFCISGSCNPSIEYTVDATRRAEEAIELIRGKQYFVLNRPRQYGKTTFLNQLELLIEDKYYVIQTSFESAGEYDFSSDRSFFFYFVNDFGQCMLEAGCPDTLIRQWCDISGFNDTQSPFGCLYRKICELCSNSDRGIVLVIDEVDKASRNEVFLTFLGTLRRNYLASKKEKASAFQSVILAGVSDVRHLKIRMRPEEEHVMNSPWNIAVTYEVDMNFSVDEIAGMLKEYEEDHHTGMDVVSVSREIREITSGHPYLVSWICKWLDKTGKWTAKQVKEAGWAFLKTTESLKEDAKKNLTNYPALREIIYAILYEGADIRTNAGLADIDLGIMYGLLKDNGNNIACIANPLLERVLYHYSVESRRLELLKDKKSLLAWCMHQLGEML